MRLDTPGDTHPYVYDNVEWQVRCGTRILQLEPELAAEAVALCVDDMCLSSRWRLMAPEEAAEALYRVPHRPLW